MNRCWARTAFAVAILGLIVPASRADTIAGNTSGCFTSVNGNSAACNTTTATDGGLTFTDGTFNVLTDANGFATIGGASTLGNVSLSSSPDTYFGDTFTLDVAISDPSAGVGDVPAQLIGDVTTINGGGVDISFTNPTQIALQDGQTISLHVNDLALSTPGTTGSSSDITGYATITKAPEPSSLLLMGSGVLSIAGIRRRWFV